MPVTIRHGVAIFTESSPSSQNTACPIVESPFQVKYSVVWTRAEPKSPAIWEYSYSGEHCYSRYSLHQEKPGHVLLIDGLGSGGFLYDDDSIVAYWDPVGTNPMHYLNGIGLAVWLEQRGVACIHANVLGAGDGAFALIGGSTVGKSTLTASLLARGFSFLSDDMLALHDLSSQFLAYPGEGQLHMWPDSVKACGMGPPERWPRVHRSYEKRVLPIESFRGVTACNGPKPIKALYLLERYESADEQASLQQLTPIDGLVTLVSHSAALDIPRVLGFEAERFAQIARLTRRISVKRLLTPSKLSNMSSVCTLIERDLSEIRRFTKKTIPICAIVIALS